MKTEFSKRQLRDQNVQMANDIFRRCVHCGLCTATCSSYVILGDERDSPRGRIYMVKDMLESGKPPSPQLTLHMDRCLTCLSCMTTCPSGVDYMHLADLARVEIEKSGKRPLIDRTIRALLSSVLPYPGRFAVAMRMGRLLRPFASLFKRMGPLAPLGAMLELLPPARKRQAEFKGGGVASPKGHHYKRVVLMTGCAQKVIRPSINDASIRFMARQGIEVIVSADTGCCGALDLHMGHNDKATAHALKNIHALKKLEEDGPLDGILINASGCGTTVKDYPHLIATHKKYAGKTTLLDDAKQLADKVFDISEFLVDYNFGTAQLWSDLKVGVHLPCSMKHGQKINEQPFELLQRAGFTVFPLEEDHICCGSAGVYNVLQGDIAASLGARKAAHIQNAKVDVVATGNLGCLTQLNHHSQTPVVHFIELLDWAYGGPCPEGLEGFENRAERLQND